MKDQFKRLFSLMLVVILLVPMISATGLTVTAESYSGKCGDNLTWRLDTATGVLNINGTGDMYKYNYKFIDGAHRTTAPWGIYWSYVKSVVIGDSVTSIGSSAFNSCTSLTSVTIGDSVTSIGSSAFDSCTSLTSVTIPDSVTSIGSSAFNSCTSLTSVSMGDSVTSISDNAFYNTAYYNNSSNWTNNVLYIGKYLIKADTSISGAYSIKECTLAIADAAFSYCTALTSVTIGDSVTSICDDAFYSCTSLTSVSIGESVTSMGDYAFASCDSLTSVTIGDSVTSIGNSAFSSCTSITSVTIPDSVRSIGNRVFYNCTSLTSVTIPDSVTSMGDYAFASCFSLTSVTIGDSVTSIGYATFQDCTSLTSVTIGDSVISIGNYAFAYCYKHTSVIIPDSVTSIGSHAFNYSPVTIKCYENSYAHTYAVNNGFKYELIIPSVVSGTCGDNLTWTLNTTTGALTIDGTGDMYDYQIDDSYNSTAPWYNYRSSIKQIVIGDSVTGIGANAFCRCDDLTTVNIPGSVTAIGSNAFVACYSLDKITIPATVTYMGSYVFTEVYLHADYIYLPLDIIIECYENSCAHKYASTYGLAYKLLDVVSGTCGDDLTWKYNTITGVLTIDGTGDMYDFEYIAGKYRPETTAPWNSYYESVTAIIINEGVTSIGDAAFVDLGAATECTISNTVTHIGRKAFNYCSSLTELTIPDSVVSIDDYAFSYCYKLTEAHIGSSVSSMGKVVFDGCSDLTEITVDASNDYFTSADGVLYNKEMTELIQYPCGNQRSEFSIPDTVTSISEYAFHDCETLTSVTVPKSVTSIGEYALHYYNVGYLPLNLTIICYENSYAHTYAINNSFEYELMCDHIYTNYISDNNATCTENGTKTAFCDHGCGTSDTVTIEGTALGHSWSDWITTVEPTYTSDGEMIRFCFKCDAGENKEIPALAAPNKPVITVNNFTVTITNADNIKDMRYALGEYTTTTEIRNAPGNVALDNGVVTANTVDGSFVYEMPNGGYYSIWIRMKDGTNYIMPLDITRITASVSTYGVKITLHDLFDVKDFYIAKGEYQTYREIKDNGYIVSVTSAKIGNKHDYTYTVYEPGVHTILVRYNDGRTALFHETLTVEEPEITVNGLQITVSNIPDVKVIRTAYGEYNTPGDTKRAEEARNFSGKSVIKGAEEYMIQYRENGTVTVVVEYNNGYVKVFHCEIKMKQSNCTQTGSSVLLRNLNGFVMIRYAMGEYSTSAEIKRAKDSKVIKPADLTGEYAIVSGLAKGTYTFCVQFDDESYNYYKITVE